MREMDGASLAEIKEFLERWFGVDVEITGVWLPIPFIDIDGKDHGVDKPPDSFKFKDEMDAK